MKDKISALMDGELEEHSAQAMLDTLRRDRRLRAEWDTYCLIGDVLRGEQATAPDFLSRVMVEIDAEPTRLAPAQAAASAAGRTRWRAVMPLVASVMGVAAVGLVARTLYSDPVETAPAAVAATARGPVTEAPAVRAGINTVAAQADSDPHRDYVFAHQSMAVGGPMPDAIQYVRTVSGVRQDGGR